MEMESHALNFKREFFDNGEKTINGSYKLERDKYTYSDWLQVIKDNLIEGYNKSKILVITYFVCCLAYS